MHVRMADTTGNLDLGPNGVVPVHTPRVSAGVASGSAVDDSDTSSTFFTVTSVAPVVSESDSIRITVIPPSGRPASPAPIGVPAIGIPGTHASEEPAVDWGQSRPSSLSSKRVRFEVVSDVEVCHSICRILALHGIDSTALTGR